jgi:Rha family phage regulatory protein
VFANRRDVADFFEKRHDHVLRDIDNLLKSLDSPKLGSAFTETTRVDGQGISRRAYNMTRDGFTLLAMALSRAEPSATFLPATTRISPHGKNTAAGPPSGGGIGIDPATPC